MLSQITTKMKRIVEHHSKKCGGRSRGNQDTGEVFWRLGGRTTGAQLLAEQRHLRLLDEIGFAGGFEDAVIEFAFVKAGLGFGFHGDLTGHFGEVGHRVPCGEELVAVGGER